MQQPGAAELSGLTAQRSRQTAVLVNLVKVALLAALAPPVVSGIADKATQFGAPSDPATVVGVALSLGAIGAVLGAVLLGRAADIGRGTHRSRWAWVAVGAATGTIGLALATVSSVPVLLIGGWMIAQFGYSGAMAVLRALLASIRQSHLRRGAIAVVFSAYGGLAIPLVLLLLFPTAVWETSLGLACVAVLSPLCVIAWFPPARTGAALDPDDTEDGFQEPQPTSPNGFAHDPHASPGQQAMRLFDGPVHGVLLLQCLSAAVIAAFIAYNSLDLHARSDAGYFPTASSSWVLIAAVLGLVGATAVLFWRPAMLASSRVILIAAGVLLASSLILRALSDGLALTIAAAALSGIAVGCNNAALLSAVLEMAPRKKQGRFVGTFSAAGALGQFVGPLLGLAILRFGSLLQDSAPESVDSYSTLFVALAALPLGWSIVLVVSHVRRVRRSPALSTSA